VTDVASQDDIVIAWLVDERGESWPWVMDPDGRSAGCACPVCAPHDQLQTTTTEGELT